MLHTAASSSISTPDAPVVSQNAAIRIATNPQAAPPAVREIMPRAGAADNRALQRFFRPASGLRILLPNKVNCDGRASLRLHSLIRKLEIAERTIPIGQFEPRATLIDLQPASVRLLCGQGLLRFAASRGSSPASECRVHHKHLRLCELRQSAPHNGPPCRERWPSCEA